MGTCALALARSRGIERLVVTAGSADSRDYFIERCGLRADQMAATCARFR